MTIYSAESHWFVPPFPLLRERIEVNVVSCDDEPFDHILTHREGKRGRPIVSPNRLHISLYNGSFHILFTLHLKMHLDVERLKLGPSPNLLVIGVG